jgi:hypothetical protein
MISRHEIQYYEKLFCIQAILAAIHRRRPDSSYKNLQEWCRGGVRRNGEVTIESHMQNNDKDKAKV